MQQEEMSKGEKIEAETETELLESPGVSKRAPQVTKNRFPITFALVLP